MNENHLCAVLLITFKYDFNQKPSSRSHFSGMENPYYYPPNKLLIVDFIYKGITEIPSKVLTKGETQWV